MHQKRQIIAGLEEQKQSMVAALWSNPNYDDTKESKGNRRKAISDIEFSYAEAVEAIERALGSTPIREEQKLSETNEFFAATERGLQKVERRVKKYQEMTGKKLENDQEEQDYTEGIDQQ